MEAKPPPRGSWAPPWIVPGKQEELSSSVWDRAGHVTVGRRREAGAWAGKWMWEVGNLHEAGGRIVLGPRAERGQWDYLIPNPTRCRNPLLNILDQWSANLCLGFSKIFLADTDLQHSDPSPREDLAALLWGMGLADTLWLSMSSGSASTFQLAISSQWLSKVVVLRPDRFCQMRDASNGNPCLASLSQPGRDLDQTASQSEGCPPSLSSALFPFPRVILQ